MEKAKCLKKRKKDAECALILSYFFLPAPKAAEETLMENK